jgi:sortase (surface protein transpeptidase)
VRGSLRVSALFLLILALLVAGAPIAPISASSARMPAPSWIDRSDAPAASEVPALPLPLPLPLPTPAEVTATPTATVTIAATAPAVVAASSAPPRSTLYRITIPRLGINLLIKEGDVVRDIDQQHTPENYAFHLPGTAMPGESGNTYLYAHARVGMFLSLWSARPGDEVFVTAPDGRLFPYVIRDVLPRVAPTDVSSAQPSTTERLTLQTSTGPNGTDPRFVVFAFPRGG